MIKHIKVSQYRCFYSLDIELTQHQVLAGANGSGKTTLLDIPTLFGELLASNDINSVFFEPTPSQNDARASNSIELIHQLQGHCFSLSLEVQIPAHIKEILLNSLINFQPETVQYELKFEIVANEKLQIVQEHLFLSSAENHFSVIQRTEKSTLFQAEGQPQTFNFTIHPGQLALSSMPADHRFFLATLWFRDYLQQYTCLYQPQGFKLRQASPPRYRTGLNSEGRGLPWQILTLKKNQPDEFKEWLELVQLALPSLQDIRVIEREDDRHAYLKIKYQNGIELPSSGLSDGTLSILALTILPYVTPLPQIITLEEPENGIHPSAIEAILQAIRAVDTQIWLTTHSPIVLAHTHLEEMLCMRLKDDGGVDVISGEQHPRLKEWQGGIDLGTLFAAGVLS
ncbi:MAG: AAA family ATPase [Thiomargarita sp.]|nr:AAA family ATPase [Thiomargarita sp.]